MLSSAYWQLYIAKNGFRNRWREMDEFRSMPPVDARRRLGERLIAQLQYFGGRDDALPEWREAAKARNPEDLWRIWPSLPIVTKKDLVTRFHPREMVPRFGLVGKPDSTGGSTGEPTHVFHTPEMIETKVAAILYARRRIGWQPGMPTIGVWGSDRDVGRASAGLRSRLRSRLQNDYCIAGFEASRSTVDQLLTFIRERAPAAVYGYSTLLEYVAREVLARGDLPATGCVRTAWNGGEMLFESQSDLFRQAFGVPILNWYGGRELAVMAYQEQAGSSLQVARPYLLVEVVDDAGKPVPPWESGRLLWTSTVCRGTPFLRYDIGDSGAYASADADESGIKAIQELHGRNAGILKLPDGRVINCIFWNHLFKEFPEVHQFQIALRSSSQIELRLKGIRFSSEKESRLRYVLHGILNDLPVSIRWMDQIPLTREGKLIQVVKE